MIIIQKFIQYLAEYGLPNEFPTEVEEFANNINTSITEEEIAKRRDMRSTFNFYYRSKRC